jgi:hypothetical protein
MRCYLSCLILCLVALPAQAQSQFNGTWTVTRSLNPAQGCGQQGSVFNIRLLNGVVSSPGGRGSVGVTGSIRFPGDANYFTGQLRGNEGGGTYSGRCTGTFTARRG